MDVVGLERATRITPCRVGGGLLHMVHGSGQTYRLN